MKFWLEKSLDQLSPDEWEALCDCCGKCCLHKILDEETGEVEYTPIACKYLNIEKCECELYCDRHDLNPECVKLSPKDKNNFFWMPETCAYRLIMENKPLPDWHYLISGDRETVHTSGNSARGKAVSEIYVHPDDI